MQSFLHTFLDNFVNNLGIYPFLNLFGANLNKIFEWAMLLTRKNEVVTEK